MHFSFKRQNQMIKTFHDTRRHQLLLLTDYWTMSDTVVVEQVADLLISLVLQGHHFKTHQGLLMRSTVARHPIINTHYTRFSSSLIKTWRLFSQSRGNETIKRDKLAAKTLKVTGLFLLTLKNAEQLQARRKGEELLATLSFWEATPTAMSTQVLLELQWFQRLIRSDWREKNLYYY